MIISAPAETIFATLADPTKHPAIGGSNSVGEIGGVREAIDVQPLTAVGQIFRMDMLHSGQPGGTYETVNRIQAFDPPNTISWKTGYDAGDGDLRFSGWIWRYDLVPTGPSETRVTLTYDWSAVKLPHPFLHFPPFPPDHLSNSLTRLAELIAL
jgi:hypothetical protein